MTYVPSEQQEDEAHGCFPRFPGSGLRGVLLYIVVSVPICGGQTGDELELQPLNPTQQWSCWGPWGHPAPAWGSQEVDCLGISSLEGRHASTCSENCQSGGCRSSSPAQRLNSQEADLPRPSWNLISKRLLHPSLPGDLHPDLGTPGSQVATILGRISFRNTHP